MDTKSGDISLKFIGYPKAPGLSVVVSWQCANSNQEALNCLQHRLLCDMKGLGETALCYEIATGMGNALMGDPVSASKFQVSGLNINASGKSFSFCFSTKASATVLGRTLKAVVKSLDPNKYISSAVDLLKSVGQKVSKEAKNGILSSVISDIKKGLDIVAVGNLKEKSFPKIKEAVEKASKYFPKMKEPKGKKEDFKPQQKEECSITKEATSKHMSFNVTGLQTMYVWSYLYYKTKKIPKLGNGKVTIASKSESKIASIKKKDKVSTYVKSKYGKLGDNLSAGVAFCAAATGLLDASAVGKAHGSSITIASIENAIMSAL